MESTTNNRRVMMLPHPVEGPPSTGGRPARSQRRALGRRLVPYLFIAPFFIGYALIFGFPVLWSLYLSLFEVRGLGATPRFVGLSNYLQLLSDSTFLTSLWNTTQYALASIAIIVPLALGLAILLSAPNLRFREIFRVGFFLPFTISGVAVAIIFRLVFSERFGLLNQYILNPLGLESIPWLRSPAFVMPAIIIAGLWKFLGLNALYFMTGLQNVSVDLLEAARIDGANAWQRFWNVTIPQLKPTLIFVMTFAIIGAYQLFAEPAVLVGMDGGPDNSGLFVTMYLYTEGFRRLNFGYAAAIGYALALIIMVISFIQLTILGTFRDD